MVYGSTAKTPEAISWLPAYLTTCHFPANFILCPAVNLGPCTTAVCPLFLGFCTHGFYQAQVQNACDFKMIQKANLSFVIVNSF